MLVQRVRFFIIEFRKLSSTKSFDRIFLGSLENIFLSLDANLLLTDDLIYQIKYIFSQRWKSIVDTSDDYTRGSNKGFNALCIALSKELASEKNESLLKFLIPEIPICYDPILLKPFNFFGGRHALSWLILNEDSTNFINILSWFSEAKRGIPAQPSYWDETLNLSYEKSPFTTIRTFATYVDLKSYRLRAFTVRELLRLRLKGETSTIEFAFLDETNTRYSNFWSYLQCRIMPTWSRAGTLPVQTFPSLHALLDIYYTEAKGNCETGTFRAHVLLWAQNLQKCRVHDINHLYGEIVQVDKKSVYLIDVLLNFLHFDHDKLKAEVFGLARFLAEHDATYILNQVELHDVYRSHKIGPFFGIHELKDDLIQLKIIGDEKFEENLSALLDELEIRQEIDNSVIEKISFLYSKSWSEIRTTKLDYRYSNHSESKFWVRLAQKLSINYLSVIYQSLLMPNEQIHIKELIKIKDNYGSVFYSFYNRIYTHYRQPICFSAAYANQMSRDIPRQVLPELLEVLEAYFVNTTDKFRELLDCWIVNLHDCSSDDVHYLYEQIIQVNNQPKYFIDALIDIRTVSVEMVEEIVFGMVSWLCGFDQSFVSQMEQLQDVYLAMKLGQSFDIHELNARLQKLKTNVTFTLGTTLDQVFSLVQTKECIDKSVIDALSNLYKHRWQVIQGQDDCYTRRQDGVNKEWINLAAALSGARLISPNYYRFLMPSLKVDMDSVKRVSVVHYPLSHYLISGVSFDEFILLDNSVDQYLTENSLNATEQFRESKFLYNCNSEKRVPLNREEHANLLYAQLRFRKYFNLTQSPEHADKPIRLATLDALTALVEGSVFPRGVKFLFDYNEDELTRAEVAYDVFCEFYNQLPEDEKQCLNNQLIHFNGSCKSFKKLLFEINSYQCIAKVGQYILQLVVDYLPHRKFIDTIEVGTQVQVLGETVRASVGLDKIRLQSRHKIPRDAVDFEHRAYLVLFSILTQPFDFVAFNASSVSAFNYVNQVISVAKDLFTKISFMIRLNDFTAYSELVYTVVKPALADKGFRTKIRSQKNRDWLESIANGSFADERHLHRVLDTHMSVSQSRSSRFFQFRSTDRVVSATNYQNTGFTSTSKRIN